MPLTSMSTSIPIGVPGLPVGHIQHQDIVTRYNRRGNTAGVTDLVITQDDDADFTFSVNGVPITYHSAASGDDEEDIVNGLIAALNASTFASPLLSGAFVSTATLRLTERVPAAGAVTITEASGVIATPSVVTAHSAEEIIFAGRAVVRDTAADRAIRIPASGAVAFDGVVVFQQVPAFSDRVGLGSTGQYVGGQPVPVMKRGVILVEVEITVAVGDAVHFRHIASGANTRLGIFRPTADSSNTTQITSGAQWVTGAAANGLAELALNLVG